MKRRLKYIKPVRMKINLYMHIHWIEHNIINNNKHIIKHMNVHRSKILEHIKEKKVVTSSEIAKLIKVSWNTADSYLKDLVIEGKVERIKKEGVNLWIIK
jgi:predicted HTH transcriptional regulator